jgi:hypothetical protein
MRPFAGNLLIGGIILRHLEGVLDQEQSLGEDCDWVLTGRLSVSQRERPLLEIDRPYRLELEDGRAGPVVVSRIEPTDDRVLVEFHGGDSNSRSG